MSTLFVAIDDFILSREAMLCSSETIDFYQRMLKPFLALANGTPPSNRMVREFLSSVAQRGVSSATVHAHARAVRAFLRFAYEEDWIEEPVTVRMPRVEQKRMEVLSREQVKRVLSVCETRDRALVMTLIDSGLRRGEALALDWEDVEFRTGAVHVRRGKDGKARVTYVGAKIRRALLHWGGGQRSNAIFPLKPSGGATPNGPPQPRVECAHQFSQVPKNVCYLGKLRFILYLRPPIGRGPYLPTDLCFER